MKLTSLNELSIERVSHNPEIQKQVMLRSGDLPHLTNFSQARFAPGQIAAAHAHADMSEVFFVTAGTANICVDGQDYRLNVGSCIAISPHEVHEITNDGDGDLVLTYFGIRSSPNP
jgi:quercetin dioxygenase-like cupin family protein